MSELKHAKLKKSGLQMVTLLKSKFDCKVCFENDFAKKYDDVAPSFVTHFWPQPAYSKIFKIEITFFDLSVS